MKDPKVIADIYAYLDEMAYLNDLAIVEEVNPNELWLCYVEQFCVEVFP